MPEQVRVNVCFYQRDACPLTVPSPVRPGQLTVSCAVRSRSLTACSEFTQGHRDPVTCRIDALCTCLLRATRAFTSAGRNRTVMAASAISVSCPAI